MAQSSALLTFLENSPLASHQAMLARTRETGAWFALEEGKLPPEVMDRIRSPSEGGTGEGVVFAFRDFEHDRLGYFGEEVLFAARVAFMINK